MTFGGRRSDLGAPEAAFRARLKTSERWQERASRRHSGTSDKPPERKQGVVMAKANRKRLTARERGYFPRAEAAASLRSLASRLEIEAKEGATSLVKMTLNFWFTEDDELTSNPLVEKKE